MRQLGERVPVQLLNVQNDQQAPQLLDVKITDERELLLSFSEALAEANAEALNHYLIDGTAVADAELQANQRDVQLTLNQPLNFGQSYTLSVQNVSDLAGNIIAFTTRALQRPQPPQPGELVFTEIMADEEPQVGLPDAEYLEIYNASSRTLSLTGTTIADPAGDMQLPFYELAAGAYITLVPSAAANSFSVDVVTPNRWIGLSNSGERLRLLNAEGALLDEVNYSPDWHATAEKAAGGWSLERIDATQLCQEETNWTSSVAAAGGTPGAVNSVAADNADVSAPTVVEVDIESASSVRIRFSEKMDTTSLKEVSNYQLQAPAAVQRWSC